MSDESAGFPYGEGRRIRNSALFGVRFLSC
jgi:hypothetical protein